MEILNEGKTWIVQPAAIFCLASAAGPTKRLHLIRKVQGFSGSSLGNVEQLVDKLIFLKLLTYEEEMSASSHRSLETDMWTRNNAGPAGEYHIATFDFQFLDYSPSGSGWQIGRQRMEKYSRIEPDENRFKEAYHYTSEVTLHSPQELTAGSAGATFEERIQTILSVAIMPTGTKNIPWSKTPLLRRTSPSGGSRHPIEAYVLTDGGILYHCNTKTRSLGQIGASNTLEIIGQHKGDRRLVCIFLTCVFERNSYRYREPRTFRSVHMDAGHIAGTIEICASTLGLSTSDVGGIDKSRLNALLGNDGFDEFLMAGLIVSEAAK